MTVTLTPTEDLVMEALTARVRCGESCWTFELRHRATLRALQAKGLVSFDTDSTGRGLLARLTDAGREEYLLEGFTEPVEWLRDELDEVRARLESANLARRSHTAKATSLEDENRRLRRQLKVAVDHLGGVSNGKDLDALLWGPTVMVLHADGSTSVGTLRVDDEDGYVLATPDGAKPVQPVGDFTGTWARPEVDIVRPVVPGT